MKQTYKKCRDSEANIKDTQGWFWTTLFNDALTCYIVQRRYRTYKIRIGCVEEMVLTKEQPSTRGINLSLGTPYTTNPHWTGLESKSGLCRSDVDITKGKQSYRYP